MGGKLSGLLVSQPKLKDPPSGFHSPAHASMGHAVAGLQAGCQTWKFGYQAWDKIVELGSGRFMTQNAHQ